MDACEDTDSVHRTPRRRLAVSSPWLKLVPVFILLLALPGCVGSSAVLAPASPQALEIADLFWELMVVAAIIFVVVEGLLIFAIIRFRARPGAGLPKQTHGNPRLEIIWTVIPVIIVSIIFAYTIQDMRDVTAEHTGALQVRVTGHRWWWEMQYPDQGITTANELHVPVGRPVDIELVSADVIHSFWVPELAGKTDVIPGHTNWVKFTAAEPGTYRGQCAEFCGMQHANMRFLVIAQSAEDFAAWTESARQPEAKPEGEDTPGAELFLERACVGCHTIDGTPAQGKVGPNLTHFGSRQGIAALTIDNTPENLASWLRDPQAIKPGSDMPNLHLQPGDIDALVKYLESLK